MDPVFEAHVLSVCSALGSSSSSSPSSSSCGHDASLSGYAYVMGDEVIECLKDLKRYLKEEEEQRAKTSLMDLDDDDDDRDEAEKQTATSRHVFHSLAKWNILEKHFVPLILTHSNSNDRLLGAIVEILVPLTWPLEDKNMATQHDALLSMKEAFLTPGLLNRFVMELMNLLAKHHNNRTNREHALIRLILLLFRNILAIRDGQPGINSTVESLTRSTLQERLVECMGTTENLLDMLVAFSGSMQSDSASSTASAEFSDWNTVVLEIVSLVFLRRNPEDVAAEDSTHKINNLANLLAKEKQKTKSLTAVGSFNRHSRFGGSLTVQSASGKRAIVHQKAPILSSIQNAIDGRKKKLPIRTKEDISLYKNISSPTARAIHKKFAVSMLENNGVNALLCSVKKDIDAEKPKIKEEDIIRYFKVSSFFLKFLGCLITKKETDTLEKCGGLDSVTMIMNKRNFIFVIKKLEMFQDEKKPEQLRQTLTCFKEMLMTLKDLSSSEDEDLQELASSIEHNVFYEEKQLNMLNLLCKHCKNESKSYLELLVETIHIHMKLLDRFSKAKKVVVIRKKRANGNADKEDDEGNVEDVRREPKFIEKELKLDQIEAAYACESVVDTYCDLLCHFDLLDAQHVHCITTMLHRIFVKCKMEAFFYKLSVLNLFQHILARKDLLQSSPQHKQLHTFIIFVLKKFFKNIQDYPLLYIDIFFKKTKSDCIRIQDMDVELPLSSSAKKNEDTGIASDDEVAFKPGIPWKSRIGVAVTLLMEKDKKWLLDWLVENMKQVIQDRSEGKVNEEGEEEEFILPNTSMEHKEALFKDKMFALLLRSMLFSLYEEELEELNVWSIPTFLSPYDLEERMELILQFMETPYEENGKNAMAMIKRRKKRGSKIADFNSDDELDIKKGVPWEEQVGIAVTVLVQKKKQWMLDWIQEILKYVAETRLVQPSPGSDYVLPTPTEEHELAICRDNQFGLLLKLLLLHFDQTGEKKRTWKIPSGLGSQDLLDKSAMIAHYIDHPYRKAGKTAAEMLRKKKPKKMREPKQGRNGERRRKKKEVLQSVLSAEFIEDSDDMDDEEFFKQENERRARIAEINNRIEGGTVASNKEKFKLSAIKSGEDEEEKEEAVSQPAATSSNELKTYQKKKVAMTEEQKMAAKAQAEAAIEEDNGGESNDEASSSSEESSNGSSSESSIASSSESETEIGKSSIAPPAAKKQQQIKESVAPVVAMKKARRLIISDDEDN